MRTLLSNSAAILLVIHAMFGCCHHHWHSDDECAAPTSLTAVCNCCSNGADTSDLSTETGAPCDGKLECQGVCTYLPAPRVELDAAGSDFSLDFAVVIPSQATFESCRTMHPALHVPPGDGLPPIRLNLLQQRLLI